MAFVLGSTAGESWDKNRRVMFLEVLPLLALIALLAISVPTGCLYYFDENGVYHRGSLFYTQQVLCVQDTSL